MLMVRKTHFWRECTKRDTVEELAACPPRNIATTRCPFRRCRLGNRGSNYSLFTGIPTAITPLSRLVLCVICSWRPCGCFLSLVSFSVVRLLCLINLIYKVKISTTVFSSRFIILHLNAPPDGEGFVSHDARANKGGAKPRGRTVYTPSLWSSRFRCPRCQSRNTG